jgi:Icc-related predicted phosphoesterase
MIIDCISDLHGLYPELEGGDLLIVAGDLTKRHTYQEYVNFAHWLWEQPYRNKIFIAGNHDPLIQDTDLIEDVFQQYLGSECQYLCDSGTEFEGLKIWGSPWALYCEGMNRHCMAFTKNTEKELAEKWALIPSDTDILVTHSPPFCCKDLTKCGTHAGSDALLLELTRVKPRLHVFGHIHEGYGIEETRYFTLKGGELKKMIAVNASLMNVNYKPVNKPIRVIFEDPA